PSSSQEWLGDEGTAPVETGADPVAPAAPCAPAAAGSTTGDVAMEPATAGTVAVCGTTASAGDRVPERPECDAGEAMRLAWINVGTEKSRGANIARHCVHPHTRPRPPFFRVPFPTAPAHMHMHWPARSERTKRRIAERERQAERKAAAAAEPPAPAKAGAGAAPKAEPTPAKAGKGGGQTARFRSTTRRS
ncbi:MAG: hypothetical protein GY772_24750, partial [bacterium]|nr:hypothetical protein [bacterium]